MVKINTIFLAIGGSLKNKNTINFIDLPLTLKLLKARILILAFLFFPLKFGLAVNGSVLFKLMKDKILGF
jgi:hypothetical protein